MYEQKKISLNIPTEVLGRIDTLAEKAGIDRTRLMVNILDETSKTLIATEKVGILQFSVLMRNLSEWLEKWSKSVKSKKVEPL
ncbi:MAG: hypothetical protein JRI36_09535 [Deltaproteobacteria bacterium]|nr:hypothetical protein [Deltaproteobacteria bacterium]